MTFGKGPKLGVLIDYASDKKGVLLEGVAKGGPADKAGLKAGDLITSIADLPVTNVTTYMTIMQKQKTGAPIPITVERAGKKVTMQIVPQ
jgi:S1-C subfamily serine protease